MRRPSASPSLLSRANGREVDRRDRAAQRLRIIAAVEVFLRDVVERHLLGPHEIFQPHLRRFEAGFPCDRIEHELEREADARARDAAEGQDRAFVGGDRIRSTTIRREIVRPGEDACDLRRFQAGRERIGGIGARIDRRLAIDAAQAAVAVRIGGDAVMVFAAIGGGREMLAAILDPANRMPAMQREPAECYLFRQQDALVAKAAADVRRDDPDAAVIETETLGQAGAHDVRHLRRRVDDELFERGCPSARRRRALRSAPCTGVPC